MANEAVFFYDPVYTDGLSNEARFPKDRYRLVRAAFAERGLDECAHVRPSPLGRERDLLTVHDPAYVSAFVRGQLEERIARRIGLRPWTERIIERTFRIMGGTVAATDALFVEGRPLAGNLAGGTHHAFASEGAGYCVFNDLAVATRIAQRDHGVQRVLIVDLDVHQGDGTAALLAADPTVFTFSMHCAENFPFRKQKSDLDVALPAGTTDETYLPALDAALQPLFARHQPELLIYQAGVDPLAEDHLGRWALTRAGLRERNRYVYEFAHRHRLPTLVLMGGGYARPIERSVEAIADVFEQGIQIMTGRRPTGSP